MCGVSKVYKGFIGLRVVSDFSCVCISLLICCISKPLQDKQEGS